MLFKCLLSLLILILSNGAHGKSAKSHSPLARAQRAITQSMKANGIKIRVAAENMANSQTADYVPKTVHMKVSKGLGKGFTNVSVSSISRDATRMVKKYDPKHPNADAKGMVNMPKIDPLLAMMDMHEAKQANERAAKSYQMTTDMRHRTIKMMN